LYCLLRPAEQYGLHSPFEADVAVTLLKRLKILTRGWDRLRRSNIGILDLACHKVLTFSASYADAQLRFYPASTDNDHLVKLNLGPTAGLSAQEINMRMCALGDKHSIGIEDQFVGVNTLRLAALLPDSDTRRLLLTIRLLAITNYGKPVPLARA
jgi:hypothetical protein